MSAEQRQEPFGSDDPPTSSGHDRIVAHLLHTGRWPRGLVRADYSITWSAPSRIDCGIFIPSALAVFRLITISYLLGCSNGISAGFAPFKILSTNSADRRYIST